MRICALVNAEGGTVRRNGGVDTERERLTAAFAGRDNLQAELVFTTGDKLAEHADRALNRARRGELDAVVAGGGDGSISAVAGVLVGTEVPLGILPLGTMNHFAKDLGVPTDLDGAVAMIAAGEIRQVDVGQVNGHVFLNNSSIGLYPRMVLDRDRQIDEAGRGKRVAKLLARLRALRRFPRRRLAIRAEGVAAHCTTPCVFIGNNEYRFGVLELGTREHLDAGELCVYVARPNGAVGLVLLAFRAAFGGLEQASDFHMFRAKVAEIGSRASRLPVSLDGEVKMLRPPLRYRIRAGALRVIGPSPASAA